MKRFILGMPSFSLSHSLTLSLTLSRPLVNSTEVPYSTRSMEATRSTETDSAPRSPEIGSAAAKRKRQPRNSACQACAALKVCRHTLLATLGTLWHPLAPSGTGGEVVGGIRSSKSGSSRDLSSPRPSSFHVREETANSWQMKCISTETGRCER